MGFVNRSLVVMAVVWGYNAVLPGSALADVVPPQIVHEPCEQYRPGEDFGIIARFYDDSPIFDPKVIYRSPAGSGWKNASFYPEDNSENFRAVIPGRNLKGDLEYFIEVFDEFGNGPARYGSPEAPVQLSSSASADLCEQVADLHASRPKPAGGHTEAKGSPLPPGADLTVTPGSPPPSTCSREDSPIYCSAIFWSVIGVVVVAGAVTAGYFLFSKGSPDAPIPQRVNLSINAPDPTTVGLRRGSWP